GRHMEFDPAVMNAEKLAVAQKHGFRRFSFGIQSLDAAVNTAHNRGAQSRSLLQKRFSELEASEYALETSCDILLGLAGTNPEQMTREIEEILRDHKPNKIDIFMITPTQEYVQSHFNGQIQLFWDHLKQFEQFVPKHLDALAPRYNYTINRGQGHRILLSRIPDHTRKRAKKSRHVRSYNPLSHQQGAPVNVLAFGPSARSSIFGIAQYQNMRQDQQWYTEGYHIQRRDEARIHLCYELRDRDTINRDTFHNLHQTEFSQRFPLAHHVWSTNGLLDPSKLLLQPQSRLERTKSLMWLVEEEKIEEEVARHFGMPLDQNHLYHLFQPLQTQTRLPGGSVLENIRDKHITLRLRNRSYDFRVAPGWNTKEAVRCIALNRIPPTDAPLLRKGIAVLRKLSSRNIKAQTADEKTSL
ncbi:MAG: hypothetical protein VX278_04655, partial [Myxococcota bacterium]|nr:hypothetical protein [Myxococcota bacterium]